MRRTDAEVEAAVAAYASTNGGPREAMRAALAAADAIAPPRTDAEINAAAARLTDINAAQPVYIQAASILAAADAVAPARVVPDGWREAMFTIAMQCVREWWDVTAPDRINHEELHLSEIHDLVRGIVDAMPAPPVPAADGWRPLLLEWRDARQTIFDARDWHKDDPRWPPLFTRLGAAENALMDHARSIAAPPEE